MRGGTTEYFPCICTTTPSFKYA